MKIWMNVLIRRYIFEQTERFDGDLEIKVWMMKV